MSDEVMVMSEGNVVEQGDSDTLYSSPQQAYTRKLLDSIPKGVSALT
jgi:peptide/nickel transport system ATP-binding protein